MKRDLWSLVLAVGFGAFTGGLVALEISERFEYGRYFWGLGAILGGFAAYFGVDFRELCSGIARAYRTTIAWRPDWIFWKATFFLHVAFSVLFFNFIPISIPVFGWEGSLAFWIIIQCLISFFVFLYATDERLEEEVYGAYTRLRSQRLYRDISRSKNIIRLTNPIAVWFYWLPCGVWYVARRAPSAAVRAAVGTASVSVEVARALGRFAATAFRYVHSQRRTIALTGATLGAVIGHELGSATLGAVAGMILCVVEHELVAVHWLKVVPNGGRA